MLRFLALLFAATPLLAQHREQITVNVVEIPVYVERFGAPVTGLTADDFELFVNGTRQKIDSFDVIDERTPAPAGAPELRRRNLVVLLFDTGQSSYESLKRAKEQASRVLLAAPGAQTFAVATIGRGGVKFIVPFTGDRIAVRRAVETLAPSAANDPFRLATIDQERSLFFGSASGAEAGLGSYSDIWSATRLGGFSQSITARASADAQGAAAQFERLEEEMHERALVEDLSALAGELAPLSGIKHVVFLSERSGLDDLSSVLHKITTMHQRFRDAGVILDAVDIAPPRAPWPGKQTSVGAPDLLYSLALDTGGTVANSLATLQSYNRITYVLAFQPKAALKSRNDVRVRVKRQPRLTAVRYRSSFNIDNESESDRGLFLADVIMNDIPQNGLSVDLSMQDGKLVATLAGDELLAAATDKKLLLDAFLYIFNDQNLVADWSLSHITLDMEKGRDFLEGNRYTIRKELQLAPGRYAAKALIRVVGSDLTGFDRADFEIGN